MKKLTGFLIKYRWIVMVFITLTLVASAFMMRMTTVNYDLAQYLPNDSMTQKTIRLLETEFGYPGMAEVMVENITIQEAVGIKTRLKTIDGVKNVIWLDDLVDVTVPEDTIPAAARDLYYKDSAALFRIEFTENDYSLKTVEALKIIRTELGEQALVAGTAEDSSKMQAVVSKEIFTIAIVVFPICLLILMLASTSWIEPFIYLLVIGISILINMGTNFIFNQVSFITHTMTAVLQMAISLDYSLFLFHRYIEERDLGLGVVPAIQEASKHSLTAISASALTTIAGFMALIFMQYRIGADIGLVLAKGIVISFLSVLFIMPVILYFFRNWIDKTRHRILVPSYHKLSRFTIRFRYVLLVAGVVLLIPFFLAQQSNHYLYGDTSGSMTQGESAGQRQQIENRFGIYNPVVLLVPNSDIPSEIALAEQLKSDSNIKDVQALVTLADSRIPREFLPDGFRSSFLSEKYSRFIILLNSEGESKEIFDSVAVIESSAQKYYPAQWYLAGKSSSIADIKASVEKDSNSVMLFSILAVLLIILFSFRSFSIPVLLVAVIQASIWINMGIPYFQGTSLVYIGYLIISSLQLGATIDYAILLSGRYIGFRHTQPPKEAAVSAISTAGISITVSALILTIAGFAEGLLSKIPSISAIGILLGRGAALSGIMVLFVLPSLLVLFDRIIMHTTLGTRDIRKQSKRSISK